MKNIYTIASVAVMAVAFAVIGSTSAHAQVVPTDATSTPMYAGGWATPCFYVRQSADNAVCNDADYSMSRFAFDSGYRESILAPWRYHIFVELPARFR